MSSRGHQTTTIIAIGIICMTIVSFVYFARSGTQLDRGDFESVTINQLQSNYVTLHRQYESLFEYKERLEKAYLSLKNEKATLLEADKNENLEFTELKELYSKQVQTLEDDLKSCHDQLHAVVLSSKSNPAIGGASSAGNNELYRIPDTQGGGADNLPSMLAVPILSASAQNRHTAESAAHGASGHVFQSVHVGKGKGKSKMNHDKAGSLDPPDKIDHIVSNVLREPIQSPIAQVPMEPAQPSSDPNQDTVGNLLI